MSETNQPMLVPRHNCPGCQGRSWRLIHSEPLDSPGVRRYLREHYGGQVQCQFNGHSYELVECTACGLAFQAHVPSPGLLNEIYDRWLPESEQNAVAEKKTFNSYRYLADQIQYMIRELDMRPRDIKVLDFGFGWAEWAKMASAFGCDVSGTELSQVRVQYAQSIGIRVIPADALPPGEFHYINTEQVFEHLLEPGKVLRQLVAALHPKGIIKISVPDAARSVRKLRRVGDFAQLTADDIMAICPFEHVNAFNHRAIVAMGKAAGLVPLRPSFLKLYSTCSGWMEPKYLARLLARPVYRHIYPKSTFVYFVRPS